MSSRSHLESASVHPHETTVTGGTHLVEADAPATLEPRRAALFATLARAGASDTRLRNFATCSQGWWLLRSKTFPTKFRAVPDRCRDRWCPDCQARRGATIRRNLSFLLSQPGPAARMLTLTLKHTEGQLGPQIDRLFRAFRRLRHHPRMHHLLRAGAYFLEVTWNANTLQWHPHLHVICQGPFIPFALLRDLWHKITLDSHIVHIRFIRDASSCAAYVTKYVTKPAGDPLGLPPDVRTALMRALAGRKTVHTFGSWSKLHLLTTPKDETWQLLGHSNELPYFSDPVLRRIGEILANCPRENIYTWDISNWSFTSVDDDVSRANDCF